MNLAHLPAELPNVQALAFPPHPGPLPDALDCLRVAVTLYDEDCRLVYINRHFHHIFRLMPPAAMLIGRSYADLTRMELARGEIDPASFIESEEGYVRLRCRQLEIGDFIPRDIRLFDGRIIEIKARRTRAGGSILLWSDATEARHAYGRLETAVELSADAFAFWDRDDRLVICNPEFLKLHGCARGRDMIGVSFADLIASTATRGLARFDGPASAWIDKRIDAHRAPAGALTVAMSDGRAYLVRERATRDGGRATIYTDITERQRAETAFCEQREALGETRRALTRQSRYLADLTERLEKADDGADSAKTTFLRTMSHELKTPLNAIIGFSDLLKSAAAGMSAEEVTEYAGLIHVAGNNLLTMLNRILDLTKIAAGRYHIRRESVPARVLLEAVRATISDRAAAKSIAISVDCPASLTIDGDESALATMVGQLAENAVSFTPEGGSVRLAAAAKGRRVCVRVSDNGPGVAAENLARILEPFEQIGRGLASDASGGGLGLPLVKALAGLHGGALTLESAPDEGLSATLDLPAA